MAAMAVAHNHLREIVAIIDEEFENGPKPKKTRETFTRPDYRQSAWGKMITDSMIHVAGSRDEKRFARRFGATYNIYSKICAAASKWVLKTDDGVVYWRADVGPKDAFRRATVPLNIKILGVLRMISKGSCFDAIAELSGMHESTMQAFFHPFIQKFNDEFKDIWIRPPQTAEEAAADMALYTRLGFPGAANSLDVTHIKYGMCPSGKDVLFTGKEGFATLAYQATVNHNGKCLHITLSHPGSRNDKSIIKLDDYMMAIKNKNILHDCEWEYFDEHGGVHKMRGAWTITDNGYHQWRMLQCPIKAAHTANEIDWSVRLESVRKDVEVSAYTTRCV